jgi:hypothetical protein
MPRDGRDERLLIQCGGSDGDKRRVHLTSIPGASA